MPGVGPSKARGRIVCERILHRHQRRRQRRVLDLDRLRARRNAVASSTATIAATGSPTKRTRSRCDHRRTDAADATESRLASDATSSPVDDAHNWPGDRLGFFCRSIGSSACMRLDWRRGGCHATCAEAPKSRYRPRAPVTFALPSVGNSSRRGAPWIPCITQAPERERGLRGAPPRRSGRWAVQRQTCPPANRGWISVIGRGMRPAAVQRSLRDHAGCAKAALKGRIFEKRCLNGMQHTVLCQALDGS